MREFALCHVAVGALTAGMSVLVERMRMAAPRRASASDATPRFHLFASWSSVIALGVATAYGLASDLDGNPTVLNGGWRLAAPGATIASAVLCGWDPADRWMASRLYCVGLAAAGMLLDSLNAIGARFWWSANLIGASFALAASYLWSRRAGLRGWGRRWGMMGARDVRQASTASTASSVPGSANHPWFVAANATIALLVTPVTFWIVATFDRLPDRMITPYAVLAAALSLGFLARGAWRSRLRMAALSLGWLFFVALGWALLPAPIEAPWLHRLVASVAATAAVIPLDAFGLAKIMPRADPWSRAGRRFAPVLTFVGGLLTVAALALELRYFLPGDAPPIRLPALAALGAALLGLAAAALTAALWPGRDPLGLSLRGRTIYVYAAETLIGLFALHIRMTMPWLFRGWFMRIWPLAVMGIAFLGVGLAEWARRRRQDVLSAPLAFTGALLPTLPLFGFWALPSEVNYALLLLAAAALYALLSLQRKSALLSLLAVALTNGSYLRVLAGRDEWGFFDHPQMWMIPPALCALGAAYLNRRRLEPGQFTAIRYFAAIVVYASSTADIFLNGVAEAPWLPAVLAGLSLAGVAAGIALRVRAFLYLGTTFLAVSLLTVVWHAAVERDQTWIWWVCGIVTGVLILALFGVLEKKRKQITAVVNEIKEWNG